MPTLLELIKTNQILIVSGEGENGTVEVYSGARTLRAIKMRLTKERSGGQRWARAKVFSHESHGFGVFRNCESGDTRVFIDIESGAYV